MDSVELAIIDSGDWGVLRDYYLDHDMPYTSLIELSEEDITYWLQDQGIMMPHRAFKEADSVSYNYIVAPVKDGMLGDPKLVYEELTKVEEGKIYLTVENTIATRKTLFLALRTHREAELTNKRRTRAYRGG